jgi:hypothetical protein
MILLNNSQSLLQLPVEYAYFVGILIVLFLIGLPIRIWLYRRKTGKNQ